MKKMLWMLVMAFTLVMLAGMAGAEEGLEVLPRGLCSNCGENTVEQAYDEEYHWEHCASCGMSGASEMHHGICDRPGVCCVCGAEGKIAYYAHLGIQYDYDATRHWVQCPFCLEDLGSFEKHYAYCDNPSCCVKCGAENVEVNPKKVAHPDKYLKVNFDTKECWEECSNCGSKTGVNAHISICEDPEHCVYCGAANVEFKEYNAHWGETGKAVYLSETQHAYLCPKCGDVASQGDHRAYCNNRDFCYACNSSNAVIGRIDHEEVSTAFDMDCHWI